MYEMGINLNIPKTPPMAIKLWGCNPQCVSFHKNEKASLKHTFGQIHNDFSFFFFTLGIIKSNYCTDVKAQQEIMTWWNVEISNIADVLVKWNTRITS